MITVTEHEHGIVRVKAPLPFPLRWVNAYLIPGSHGYTLIDPGLRTKEAETLWTETLAERGIAFGDIGKIVLTHYHPDHYGLAGWFQERSGAPVLLTAEGRRLAYALWEEQGETTAAADRASLSPLSNEMIRLFVRHGMPADMAEPMAEHMSGFVPQVSPPPAITPIDIGTKMRLGDHDYDVLETPGHAVGHVCFWSEETGVLFCGDHVLPQITPNVGYVPGFETNALHSFLGSLETMTKLTPAIAFPGHRDPFTNVQGRALEIINHHRERLDAMAEILREPMTAYELCTRVFSAKLSLHQLRFAIGETLAHLIYLEQNEGTVVSDSSGETVIYLAK